MAGAVLLSVPELISALGGPRAVARLTGRSPSAVCQWTYQRGRPPRRAIPPELYFVLSDAAARKGFTAPAWLFRFEVKAS